MRNWGRSRCLKAELDQQDIVSKRREGAGGRLAGGQHFSRGALYLMLQNRLYRGEITHQGEAYPGQHEAILDPELWQIVQDKLAANRQECSLAVGAEAPSLLAGLIVDADGNCGPAKCIQAFRAMARRAARRDEKPRPGHCRADNRSVRSDRNPAESGERRRGA
jgi:hypothetical protein